MNVRFADGREIPMEMHKVRIIQKANLVPVDQRLKAITEGESVFKAKTLVTNSPSTREIKFAKAIVHTYKLLLASKAIGAGHSKLPSPENGLK